MPHITSTVGAIWFLWALFWSEIFLKISLSMKKGWRILFVGSLFAVGYFTRNIFWLPLSIQPGALATLFLYIGYLIKTNEEKINIVPKIFKTSFSILAIIITILFIKDFKSFYLVDCDIGRGLIDVIGSLCACWVVILISKWIEKHTHIIKKIFLNIHL